MALSVIGIIEAKKDFLIRFMKGVACSISKIEIQIVLTLQLASYDFADLK